MTPAGYSGTPLPKKLGLAAGKRFSLVGAPAGFERTLGPVPAGAERVGPRAACDLVLLFRDRAAGLPAAVAAQARRLPPDGALWIAWPKQSSGVATDLSGDVVRGTGLAAGLVDVKVCAVDETWSGLKFVRRLADRPRPARKA